MKLTIVLPAGQVIHTGSKAHKSSSGYDLTRMFVGSEGTLGIVTEATLKLSCIPSHHLATTITFKDLDSASAAVAILVASGLEPAALELLPPTLIKLMNQKKNLNIAEEPSLFCEFHRISKSMLKETADLARELCQECGATSFKSGIAENDRRDLWRARHEAWETIHQAYPGKETLIVDAAVPISCYPEMIIYSQNLVDEYHVSGYVFGHAGDGNLHVVIPGDPDDENEWSTLEKINQ